MTTTRQSVMKTSHRGGVRGSACIALVLALCLVVTMVPVMSAPQAAQADPEPAPAPKTTRTIMLGTSGVEGFKAPAESFETESWGDAWNYAWNYMYLGTSPYNKKTVKWRVLDAEKANNGEANSMFLLSEELQSGGMKFVNSIHGPEGNAGFTHQGPSPENGDHTNCKPANSWQGSDAQKWCQNFATSAFSQVEQSAIKKTNKSDAKFMANTTEEDITTLESLKSDNILADDQVFFLSAEEEQKPAYGFGRFKTQVVVGQDDSSWWLRSPMMKTDPNPEADIDKEFVGFAQIKNSSRYSGQVEQQRPTWGDTSPVTSARPAMNLDSSKVLFTSASTNTQPAVGSQLSAIGDYTDQWKEWKLTLLDSARTFSVNVPGADANTITVEKGTTTPVNLTYSDAKPSDAATGTNEYVSAIITDTDDNALYYGRLAQVSQASGTVSLVVPDLAYGSYTVKLFNEQANDSNQANQANRANVASKFVDVPLQVEKKTPTAADFDFGQAQVSYNGLRQESEVKVKDALADMMGKITKVEYCKADENGTFAENNFTESDPVNVGRYKVRIDVAEGTDYKEATGITDNSWVLEIVKGRSTVELEDDLTATYGTNFELKASVEPEMLFQAPAPQNAVVPMAADNEVEFFVGEGDTKESLGTAKVDYDIDGSGTATLSVSTTDGKLKLGENKVSAEYGGSINLNNSGSSSITVTLTKTIGLSWNGAAERRYDGTPSNVTAQATGTLGNDNLQVSVTGGNETNAGTHTARAESLSGDNAQYYLLPETNTQSYNITQATPTANPNKQTTAEVPEGSKLKDATVSEGEFLGIDSTTPIKGTFEWVDGNKTTNIDGTEQMVFTPSDPNYAPVTIDVAVSVIAASPTDPTSPTGPANPNANTGAVDNGNGTNAANCKTTTTTTVSTTTSGEAGAGNNADDGKGASAQTGDTPWPWAVAALALISAVVGTGALSARTIRSYRAAYAGKHSAPRRRR